MKRLDFIIIGVVLLLAGAIFLGARLLSWEGAMMVEIYVDGKLTETLPLSDRATKTIHTGYGENTIQIGPDGAVITDADCPGKDCVLSSAISRPGQSIVCLPNRFLIRLSGSAGGEEVDAVAG